jgi:hypothetical protein
VIINLNETDTRGCSGIQGENRCLTDISAILKERNFGGSGKFLGQVIFIELNYYQFRRRLGCLRQR